MFTFDGNLKFVRIDLDYIKALHDVCGEVFYSTVNYENKPYIGLLVTCDGHQYVIPLTSAKEKHKKWRDVDTDRFLIYEMADQARLGTRDIWTKADDPNEARVKHILSAIDLKKMIPVCDGVITRVNFNPDPSDDAALRKYKELLNKEYGFCIKIKDMLLVKASKLYERQIRTGKVKFCCDFKKLESIADSYLP